MPDEALITLTADIVAAHVSHNKVGAADVGEVISGVHSALAALGQPPANEADARQPAVSIKASVKPDHIVCLICGSKQKMLKRHLRANHGISAAEYKAEFGLPASYQLTAPNYAKMRSEHARANGLGKSRKKTPLASSVAESDTSAPAAPARKRLKIKAPS